MTRCVTDAELQAVADHEASAELRQHVASCAACQQRVDDARRTLQALRFAVEDGIEMPAAFVERVDRAVRERPVTPRRAGVRGATTMVSRDAWAGRAWASRRSVVGAAAALVVLLFVAVGVWPGLRRESTLSAAEILGRSLQTMSGTRGVELLEYEVRIEGSAMQRIAPEIGPGTLRIQQAIDHDRRGRFRIVMLDANGTLVQAMAQDPDRRLRTGRVRTEDGTIFFRLTARADRPVPRVSPMDLQRGYLRAVVSVMQATTDSKLTVIEDAGGGAPVYAVQVPPVSVDGAQGAQAIWELHDARAVIRGSDFLLTELTAHGTVLDEPFGISFKLVRREVRPGDRVDASSFEIASAADDLVIEGVSTEDPLGDLVRAAMKELAQARGR